jgi:2-polyprenyl-3-methyl-5-hydroxy-6-metoxy-1,4-benzoquinol methylase
MSAYFNGLNQKLFSTLPARARSVLELGCANGRLGAQYKISHPDTRWTGIEISADAAREAAHHLDEVHVIDVESEDLSRLPGGYDLVVLGDLLEHMKHPERLLERLFDMTAENANMVICLPNMGHVSVLHRLLAGDISYDDAGLLDRTHLRFYSAASAFKTILDAGWLPDLQDTYDVPITENKTDHLIMLAAESMGLPSATARRNLSMYQMVINCIKWPLENIANIAEPERFSVIVPVTRPWQNELNIKRSPGLAEVQAEIICISNAENAAQAYAKGRSMAKHPWVIFAHQDVYFPTGTGYAISKQLGRLTREHKTTIPAGFAGIARDPVNGASMPAGLVIDRTRLFNQPASQAAISLDEFAIAMHHDMQAHIDPKLGWHLWATDLCLQQNILHRTAPHVLRVPLFHNSTTAHSLPPEFEESARILAMKYPTLRNIPTLCGAIQTENSLHSLHTA